MPAGREAPGREAPRAAPEATKKRPLYIRLLRLRHIAPNAVQRALLGEGVIAVAILLVLADLASAWTLLVLPLAVAGVVKANDALAGLLQKPPRVRPDEPARAGKQKAPAPKGTGAVGLDGPRRRLRSAARPAWRAPTCGSQPGWRG